MYTKEDVLKNVKIKGSGAPMTTVVDFLHTIVVNSAPEFQFFPVQQNNSIYTVNAHFWVNFPFKNVSG